MRLSINSDNGHSTLQGRGYLGVFWFTGCHPSYLWSGDGVVVRHESESEVRGDTTICALPESDGGIRWLIWHSEIGPAYDSGRVQGWYLGDVEIFVQGEI